MRLVDLPFSTVQSVQSYLFRAPCSLPPSFPLESRNAPAQDRDLAPPLSLAALRCLLATYLCAFKYSSRCQSSLQSSYKESSKCCLAQDAVQLASRK